MAPFLVLNAILSVTLFLVVLGFMSWLLRSTLQLWMYRLYSEFVQEFVGETQRLDRLESVCGVMDREVAAIRARIDATELLFLKQGK